MNYKEHYSRLVDRAKYRVLSGYKEKHHVIPRCIGGCNDASNIVNLTPEEHLVAHLLLAKIYKKIPGIIHSANIMASRFGGNKKYGWLRRMHAEFISKRLKGKPKPPRTAKHIANLSASIRGKKYKKRSPEHCKKISERMIGNKLYLKVNRAA